MKKTLAALVITLGTAALAQDAVPSDQAQQEQQRNEGRRISTGLDATEVAPKIKDTAKDAKDSIAGKSKDAKKDTQQALDSNSEPGIGGSASDTKNDAKDTATDVKNDAKDKAHDAKNATKDKAHDAKNATKDKAHDAKNAAKDAAHDVKNTAKDATHSNHPVHVLSGRQRTPFEGVR